MNATVGSENDIMQEDYAGSVYVWGVCERLELKE